MADRAYMLLSSSPKYAVSAVAGYMKGKNAIHPARLYGERRQNFVGQYFWAWGYRASAIGRDKTVIREYIRNQEQDDKRLDELNLGK